MDVTGKTHVDLPPVLGLLLVHPARPAFDAVVREILVPRWRSGPGLRGIWPGRRGPDDMGERAIATLWDSEAQLWAFLEGDPVVGWLGAEIEIVDARFQALQVRAEVRTAPTARPSIMRVARGRLAHIDLPTYAQHVDAGARRDLERGRGPDTLILGASGPDTFVTVSTWSDWEAVAVATGASLDRPVRTREQHVLDGFTAVHYELIPI